MTATAGSMVIGVVMMNPHEMVELGLKTGDEIDLTSHHRYGTILSTWKVVPIDPSSGNLAAYFPEANVLVPLDSTASDSNTPTSKRIIVSVSQGVVLSYVLMNETGGPP